MEAAGTSLPELDEIRVDPKSSPEGREGNLRSFRPSLEQFVLPCLYIRAIGNLGRLVFRDPGSDPGLVWPAAEVGQRLVLTGASDSSTDNDLPLQFPPVDDETGAGIGLEIPPLA